MCSHCAPSRSTGLGGSDQHPGHHGQGLDNQAPKESSDASTNTNMLDSHGASRPFKPALVSFRDERARWEWLRRAVPLYMRARRARAWGINDGQASWGECNRQQEQRTASLARRMEVV